MFRVALHCDVLLSVWCGRRECVEVDVFDDLVVFPLASLFVFAIVIRHDPLAASLVKVEGLEERVRGSKSKGLGAGRATGV